MFYKNQTQKACTFIRVHILQSTNKQEISFVRRNTKKRELVVSHKLHDCLHSAGILTHSSPQGTQNTRLQKKKFRTFISAQYQTTAAYTPFPVGSTCIPSSFEKLLVLCAKSMEFSIFQNQLKSFWRHKITVQNNVSLFSSYQ